MAFRIPYTTIISIMKLAARIRETGKMNVKLKPWYVDIQQWLEVPYPNESNL
jgi:hypothetical protein